MTTIRYAFSMAPRTERRAVDVVASDRLRGTVGERALNEAGPV